MAYELEGTPDQSNNNGPYQPSNVMKHSVLYYLALEQSKKIKEYAIKIVEQHDEIKLLKVENERLKEQYIAYVYQCEKLAADKAELLQLLKDVTANFPKTSWFADRIKFVLAKYGTIWLLLLCMGCSGLSWQSTRGGYTYFNNRVSGCEAPYPKTPMKKTNYNTQAYYWQRR